ncbi:MAG: class I poly(R)-hydroxyalkanoic acid synthase [Proteobacteria bacterium]|nr:class I poly(R)-hydroxyalkanoic acid synthase [Pseudomonadota bacterium]
MTQEPKKTGFNLKTLSELMLKFSEKQKRIADSMTNQTHDNEKKFDATLLTDFFEIACNIASDPTKLMKTQNDFFTDCLDLATTFTKKMYGDRSRPPMEMSPVDEDKRFTGGEWEKIPYFQFLRDSYLMISKNINHTVAHVTGVDHKKKQRVEFLTRQILDALSPSNYLFTNPELLKLTFESGGENIMAGFENFIDDINCIDGTVDIKMTDTSAFILGENIASTPGSVVFQNDLIQLIQYAPATPTIFATPLVISPPFINKYYILDINENNSFVKWLVDQGYTVFVISWVNPDKSHKEKTYTDYMMQGHIEAFDVIEKITKQPKLSAIGYCTGGTLLASTAAYLAAKGEDRFASLTYMASLIDFSDPGDLGHFVDSAQVESVIDDIEGAGYLDGRHLAKTFNMLRSNDLVWSYAINNYLKGKRPLPFNILYWNSDSTNLPARMYGFYLQNMYVENRLIDPGGIILNEVPLDLRNIKAPAYYLATEEDHIVLWHAVYKGTFRHSGDIRFVLGGSGHVAGVVNPPGKHKYGFRVSDTRPEDPGAWLESSKWTQGSWWVDWYKWHQPYAGKIIAHRIPGKGKYKEIEPAPGSYVKNTILKQD